MTKVLMVVTNNDQLGNTGSKTGVYLSEFLHPYNAFKQAGFDIDIASPKGGIAPLDPHSLSDMESSRAEELLSKTLPLNTVDKNHYDAVLVVGGHGTMWDLPDNSELHSIIRSTAKAGGIVSSVCHGSSVLAKIKKEDGGYLLAGKRVTGFSNAEESTVGADKVVPFLVESALIECGALYESADIFQAKVVQDGQFITGQNPASSEALAQKICDCINSESELTAAVR